MLPLFSKKTLVREPMLPNFRQLNKKTFYDFFTSRHDSTYVRM
jgi:hypothetical protein